LISWEAVLPHNYLLIDSGKGEKLERFADHLLIRPCPQALWLPQKPQEWERADARFTRLEERGTWQSKRPLPKSWTVALEGVTLKVAPTDFGHLGVFPEHAAHWSWMNPLLRRGSKVLHLFAYSGGATLAAAQAGASVCHVDSAKGMVDWARENAALNQLETAPIRWIVDDAVKFMKREVKRNSFYDAIILDPPTFGRGAQGEVFKIEDEILPLLELCKALLTPTPAFILFSCHTPGFTPTVLHHLFSQVFRGKGKIDAGEMLLSSPVALSIPSGTYLRWTL
jgi:23S rRNA (cytosine1962-C5)-methyltransferase